jgi:hypothetical protein
VYYDSVKLASPEPFSLLFCKGKYTLRYRRTTINNNNEGISKVNMSTDFVFNDGAGYASGIAVTGGGA